MEILNKKDNISKKVNASFIAIVLILTSLSSIILFVEPVSACHFYVGTFESDHVTPKTTFLRGEIVYGKGWKDESSGHLKLRIRDPSNNIVYHSNPVHGMEVTGSFVLDDDAPTGEWDIQIGIFEGGSWNWSTGYGRIAYFDVIAQPEYTLTININSLGTVTKDPDQTTYTNGTLVQLTANHETGWTFDHWSGDLTGSNNLETINMTSNKTVTAHFTEDQYTLTINIVGNGNVAKDPNQSTYTYGTLVELTATADPGWTFDYWSGDLSGSSNPATISMTGDKTVTATFTEDQYTLTININGSGNVSKDPDQESYTYGTLINLTATADLGWTFDSWSGDLNSNKNPETINMTANKNITAYFKKESTNGGGTSGGGTNSGGTNTGGKSNAENLQPIANLSAGEPYQGVVNSEIIFNGSRSYDPDGYIISWKWDFGDGSNGEGEMATHSYPIAGIYTIILTVTDNEGATNDSETSVLVIQPNSPPSNPEINGPTNGKKDSDYTYTAVSSDNDNDSIKYIFDWGDGTSNESEFLPNGTIFAITHKWTSTGSYTFKVTANDNQTISSSELTVVIEEPEPKEDNLALLVLALLALILLILFLLLSKRKKGKAK